MIGALRNSPLKAGKGWLVAAALLALVATPFIFAQQPTSIRSASPKALPNVPARPPAKTPAAGDRRDVLLLLDGGPLHLRLNVALGGVSLVESRRQVVNRLMESLDKDKDGKLSHAEAAASPILRMKERKNANAFLEKLKADTKLKRSDVEQKIDRMGGEVVAYRQDMRTSENDVDLSKDTDGDECVAFQEFLPPPPPATMMQVALTPAPPTPPPVTSLVADIIVRDIREPLLPRD